MLSFLLNVLWSVLGGLLMGLGCWGWDPEGSEHL